MSPAAPPLDTGLRASTSVDARPAHRRHPDATPQVHVTGTPSRRRGGANDKEAA
ncbi:hypothetical protein [Streptomyces sp. NBC_00102]|uniref:hypothetical protein n=1 Tax=Streptomyces sp. NBC_00102 TaxID=2975652 RepID=UPI002250C62D|nr:hypothetical protein [Streptomyces sp. NBC_00102]MCX5397334.1 hypothetical protein [Streptomyces sp. NBC_00102]